MCSMPFSIIERACKLNLILVEEVYSLTYVETQAGDLSVIYQLTSFNYWWTNFMEKDLFFKGIRPAVNVVALCPVWI